MVPESGGPPPSSVRINCLNTRSPTVTIYFSLKPLNKPFYQPAHLSAFAGIFRHQTLVPHHGTAGFIQILTDNHTATNRSLPLSDQHRELCQPDLVP